MTEKQADTSVGTNERTRAVIVGIDKLENDPKGSHNLWGAVNDAIAWAKFCVEDLSMDPREVVVLINPAERATELPKYVRSDNAKLAQLKKHLQALGGTIRKREDGETTTGLFVFSGHGTVTDEKRWGVGQALQLCPQDVFTLPAGRRVASYTLLKQWLLGSSLELKVAPEETKNLTVVIDACHTNRTGNARKGLSLSVGGVRPREPLALRKETESEPAPESDTPAFDMLALEGLTDLRDHLTRPALTTLVADISDDPPTGNALDTLARELWTHVDPEVDGLVMASITGRFREHIERFDTDSARERADKAFTDYLSQRLANVDSPTVSQVQADVNEDDTNPIGERTFLAAAADETCEEVWVNGSWRGALSWSMLTLLRRWKVREADTGNGPPLPFIGIAHNELRFRTYQLLRALGCNQTPILLGDATIGELGFFRWDTVSHPSEISRRPDRPAIRREFPVDAQEWMLAAVTAGYPATDNRATFIGYALAFSAHEKDGVSVFPLSTYGGTLSVRAGYEYWIAATDNVHTLSTQTAKIYLTVVGADGSVNYSTAKNRFETKLKNGNPFARGLSSGSTLTALTTTQVYRTDFTKRATAPTGFAFTHNDGTADWYLNLRQVSGRLTNVHWGTTVASLSATTISTALSDDFKKDGNVLLFTPAGSLTNKFWH